MAVSILDDIPESTDPDACPHNLIVRVQRHLGTALRDGELRPWHVGPHVIEKLLDIYSCQFRVLDRDAVDCIKLQLLHLDDVGVEQQRVGVSQPALDRMGSYYLGICISESVPMICLEVLLSIQRCPEQVHLTVCTSCSLKMYPFFTRLLIEQAKLMEFM